MLRRLITVLSAASTARTASASPPDAVGSRWNTPALELDSLLPPGTTVQNLGGELTWGINAHAGPGAQNCSFPGGLVRGSVPGDIYTDLHRAGVIDDPLAAFGDWRTAWAGRTSWTYSRNFTLLPGQLAKGGSTVLIAEGIETNATVSINGEQILVADDSWITWKVAVHELLRPGPNTIAVKFTSVYDACMFDTPARSNVSCPGRVYVRQAASSWGWDWAKRFSPQGIWRPIYLAHTPAYAATAVITAVAAIVRPVHGQPAAATSFDVTVRLSVFASAAVPQAQIAATGNWSGGQHSVTVTAALVQGENSVELRLGAEGVALWWPAGYGLQPLYSLTANVSGSSMTRLVGFRSVRLQTDGGTATEGERTGSGNSSMILLVNGARILVRGSSLVPLDTFNGRTTEVATLRMLESVKRANMNALRVWGGGTFLPPRFYELCDSLGIMLLHDFMLSWYPNVPYPAFPAFRERIRREVAETLTALARHPAIVLWFGGNEDQCTKYKPSLPYPACQGKNWYPDCTVVYDDCIAIYIDTVLHTASNCSAVPLWPVSPSAGWLSGVDRATGLPLLGAQRRLVELDSAVTSSSRWNQGALDVHGPYGSPQPPNSLEASEGRVLFHSEFGQLSLPQFETIASVLPEPEMWSVGAGAMAQRSPNGAIRTRSFIEGTLGTGLVDFGGSSDRALAEARYRRLAYLSQLAQSEALRVIVDGGRLGVAAAGANDYSNGSGVAGPLERPWGYLFWQLNDVTQGSSWGSLEYGGRLKLVHYAARRWFAPVRVECNILSPSPPPWATPQHQQQPQQRHEARAEATCSFTPNVDYSTSDMRHVSAHSKEECCRACSSDKACTAGVFTHNNSQCWLKSAEDVKHPIPARPGIPTEACVVTGSAPQAAKPHALACTAANDGAAPWSGVVTLAIASMRAKLGAMPNWTTTIDVGPVPPGEARRFFLENVSAAMCPATDDVCWLYGQYQGARDVDKPLAARAAIGLPLQPLRSLVTAARLPQTNVSVNVTSTSDTTAKLEVTAGGAAAALYVHVTTAQRGEFSETGFHLLAGETRKLTFEAWPEYGALDAAIFTKSLHVNWLNTRTWEGMA